MNAELLSTDPVSAARQLLGAVIIARGVSARIVEVEAYGGPLGGPWPDPASHSYRGLRLRNAVMFGPAGRLYTYRSYGIHICANVSCGPEGVAAAVLLRAAVIQAGTELAHTRRGVTVRSAALARGPGNLCSALGITMDDNGIDVCDSRSAVMVVGVEDSSSSTSRSDMYQHGPRVGVSAAADRPWRFWLTGHPEVSGYRRSSRAPQPGAST